MKNKVFFNNSCNICRTEINHYKKHSNENIEWVDITDNKEAQQITSKSYSQLLRRMHVIQDGKLIEGAEVFLIIWKNIPKYNFLYKIFSNKPLFFLLNILYKNLYLGIFFQIIRNTSAPSINLPSWITCILLKSCVYDFEVIC